MSDRVKAGATMVFVVVLGFIFIAFGVGSHKVMPDYAGVYLAHNSKTYVPLPCFKKWEAKTARIDSDLGTAGEARKLRYRIEDGCQEYLVGEQQSLATSYLSDWGILKPPKEWWDRPYRTDAGVIYPKPTK